MAARVSSSRFPRPSRNVLERPSHACDRHPNVARERELEALGHGEPRGGVKWLAGQRGRRSRLRKPAVSAARLHSSINRRPRPRRAMRGSTKNARIRAGSVAGSSSGSLEDFAWSPPNSVRRRLPAAAGDDGAFELDDEVGAVRDQLRIDPEHMVDRGVGLRGRVVTDAELACGTGDQLLQDGYVGRLRLADRRGSGISWFPYAPSAPSGLQYSSTTSSPWRPAQAAREPVEVGGAVTLQALSRILAHRGTVADLPKKRAPEQAREEAFDAPGGVVIRRKPGGSGRASQARRTTLARATARAGGNRTGRWRR